MQLKSLFPSIPALFIFFFMTIAGAQETTEGKPLAFLPTDKYEFEPILEGTEIIHDFVIKNKGTAPLKILKVGTD